MKELIYNPNPREIFEKAALLPWVSKTAMAKKIDMPIATMLGFVDKEEVSEQYQAQFAVLDTFIDQETALGRPFDLPIDLIKQGMELGLKQESISRITGVSLNTVKWHAAGKAKGVKPSAGDWAALRNEIDRILALTPDEYRAETEKEEREASAMVAHTDVKTGVLHKVELEPTLEAQVKFKVIDRMHQLEVELQKLEATKSKLQAELVEAEEDLKVMARIQSKWLTA
jgi:hypothetical protein